MNERTSSPPPSDAVRLSPNDTVATVLELTAKGQTVLVRDGTGARIVSIEAVTSIPAFHKIALRPHAPGDAVIKYSEPIGLASRAIRPGEHVHTFNLRGTRGEGERDYDGRRRL